MKAKKSCILVWITFSLMLLNLRSYGQATPLPYYENFDTAANLRWTTYERGTNNEDDFPWYITIHNPYSQPFSMMHTCNTGTTQADNWTVSKNSFSFTTGGKIDSIRSWITSANPPGINDTIGFYLLVGNRDPALASAKILLHDFRGANFQTGSWVKNTNITIPPVSGTSYIAFRYKTANNCINIFFDNMRLSGNATTGVMPVWKAEENFKTGPNPVVSHLMIQTKEQFEIINIYDGVGRKVYTQPFQSKIDLSSLPKGTYILELVHKNNKRGVRKMIKL